MRRPDRGYLDLPAAYYPDSPTDSCVTSGSASSSANGTFGLSNRSGHTFDENDDSSVLAWVTGVWDKVAEAGLGRRKSLVEVEEAKWFNGLVDCAEEERRQRERGTLLACVGCVFGLVGLWWVLGGSF